MVNLIIKSYAKLNLYLEVINKRSDGFHNIRTLFERISLCDDIILKPRQDKAIKIACNNRFVPKDNSNLCYQSAKILRDAFKIKKGVTINIIKRIPVGAGLGGGSSNAAAALLGLDRFWRLRLSQKKLLKFAAMIGSDVPFFIYGCSFGIGLGRGEKIRPLDKLGCLKLWHVLVVPKIKVSTPFIYEKWDRFSKLTRPKYDVNILTLALKDKGVYFPNGFLFNSLEDVTVKFFPEVRAVKDRLAVLGLKSILMSGSGPAVFGIVNSRKEARAVREKLKKEAAWQCFVTKTF